MSVFVSGFGGSFDRTSRLPSGIGSGFTFDIREGGPLFFGSEAVLPVPGK
jgi:hypothetical protein